jgi:hypothetical protein
MLVQAGEGAEVDHARAWRRRRRIPHAGLAAEQCRNFLHIATL